MLTVICAQNKALFQPTLNDMFNLRYRVFVERWGWNLPNADHAAKLDIDQFDKADTFYLVHVNDETGRVQAACRFNPTTEPHLLSEVFPECCSIRGIPQGEDIMECSRLVCNEIDLSRRDYIRVGRELSYGITALCFKLGVRQMTWLGHMGAYEYGIRLWPSKPLGLPIEFPDGRYAAAISDINEVALAQSAAPLRGIIPALTIPLPSQPEKRHLQGHWKTACALSEANANGDTTPRAA